MDSCIWVYPLTAWQIIEDDLKDLSAISGINRSFIRNTVRYASSVAFDKQGRIMLSTNLLDYAQLKKDALIIGMVNKIEIWDPKVLAKVDKQNLEMDSSEYDELADKIIL
jgi:MraZ protein